MNRDTDLDFAAGKPPAAKLVGYRFLKKTLDLLTSAMSVISGILFLAMTALVVVQVLFRYVLNSPLVGSEEAARIAMIFVVMIGTALCTRNGTHMAVTYFEERFPPLLRLTCKILVTCCIVTLSLILIFKGLEFANRAMFMKTPALQIPRGYVAWAFPIGGGLMLLYSIQASLEFLLGITPNKHEKAIE